jgi:predicted nuclease with TOPRIM domain
MNTTLIISIIGLCFSGLSVLCVFYFNHKNSKTTDVKDIEERVRNDTKINVKLDNIGITMQEVRTEISSIREEMKSYNERLVKVEESTKQAHHRLDGLEERLNGKEDGK